MAGAEHWVGSRPLRARGSPAAWWASRWGALPARCSLRVLPPKSPVVPCTRVLRSRGSPPGWPLRSGG